MIRYKTETRPGLVALYDIRPGNGAGQFLQPQSPHGATTTITTTTTICGDACPLSCASAEAYKLAQCTRPQGWGS